MTLMLVFWLGAFCGLCAGLGLGLWGRTLAAWWQRRRAARDTSYTSDASTASGYTWREFPPTSDLVHDDDHHATPRRTPRRTA